MGRHMGISVLSIGVWGISGLCLGGGASGTSHLGVWHKKQDTGRLAGCLIAFVYTIRYPLPWTFTRKDVKVVSFC